MTPHRLADRRQRRRRKTLFWLAVMALLVWLFLVGDHRPDHLALLWLEGRRTEQRIDDLRAEKRELALRADSLRTDSLAIERMAREKGMIRPGDMVYRIVPVPPDVREAAAESLALRAAVGVRDSTAGRAREKDGTGG